MKGMREFQKHYRVGNFHCTRFNEQMPIRAMENIGFYFRPEINLFSIETKHSKRVTPFWSTLAFRNVFLHGPPQTRKTFAGACSLI